MEIINATDGYKLGHHRMYPEGTQMVYSNWTPRSNRYFPEATEGSVVFGIQYFVKKYLIEEFNKWFALPKEEAIKQFAYRVGNFVDLNQVGTKHIEELYDLGYLPIEIKALPEGSITLERQRDIYARLENAHMAACNLVLGIGSYTYQFKSRDSLGFAVKATACIINGRLIEIYKHPKTDDGTKNSLKGLIRVEEENGKYVAYDQQTKDAELQGCLKTVFVDGELVREYSLSEIRERVNSTLV